MENKIIKSKFAIMQHLAIKAGKHWDIRFRKPNSNIWDSFALRKEPPSIIGQKVLAVRTHDHTEKEALFIGKIESGYGKGELLQYDEGDCNILKYSPSHIVINFKGKKINGIFHFINTGIINRKGNKYSNQNYLFFKGRE